MACSVRLPLQPPPRAGVARGRGLTSPSCDHDDIHEPEVSRQPFGLRNARCDKAQPRSSQGVAPRCPQPHLACLHTTGLDTSGSWTSWRWQDGTRKTSVPAPFQRQHRGLRCPRIPAGRTRKTIFLFSFVNAVLRYSVKINVLVSAFIYLGWLRFCTNIHLYSEVIDSGDPS